MVTECSHCGSAVGEESCVGCITATPIYYCSRCKQPFPNPHFKSNVKCGKCGNYIYEEPSKTTRHTIKAYVCQTCGNVEENPVFTNFHSCEGCKPPTCIKCGALLATNSLITYWKCTKCNHKEKK